MDNLKNAANYVGDSVKSTILYAFSLISTSANISTLGATSTGSKEANKQVAKDNDATLGTRASAAKDAVGDKFDEQKHDKSADVHKEAAKH
ncbi:hypothetical protein CHU98_g819 [Xylaria longipes]|nr:hypothetical protein CHU98_g819 [Xylaria longipes]